MTTKHYQVAGFSKNASRLAAAPQEYPQETECMTTGGFALLTGPQDKELFCLVTQLLILPPLCISSLILMACHLKLSKDTGPA